jgi:hypothetical protein
MNKKGHGEVKKLPKFGALGDNLSTFRPKKLKI